MNIDQELMYIIIYPIKFPISYGVFFLIPLLITNHYNYIYLFYPYILICSLIGGLFCLYFLIKINEFITFQSIYSDPFLALLYPNHHEILFYRVHLCLMLLMKCLLINFWPLSFNFESFVISSLYFIFMYLFNVFLFFYS